MEVVMPALTALSHTVSVQLGHILTVFGLRLARRLQSLRRAIETRRELQVLARFDDRMLADIGLNRADVQDAASVSLLGNPRTLLRARALERRLARRGITNGFEDTPAVAPSIVPKLDTRTVAQARHAFGRCTEA
jgi:uncharacterized protein YjiS (DUF1127 family)